MSVLNVDIIRNAAGTGPVLLDKGFSQTAEIRSSEGAGTTTLVSTDKRVQAFNLSAARTVKLPTTGILAGESLLITNRTDFLLTIQSSDGTSITQANGASGSVGDASHKIGYALLRCIQDTPTASTHWIVEQVYDQGSFTHTINFSSSTGTAAITGQASRYTRANRKVSIQAQIAFDKGTGSGNLRFAALPFTSETVSSLSFMGQSFFDSGFTISSNALEQHPVIGSNSTQIQFTYGKNNNTSSGNISDANLASSATIVYALEYNT